MKSPHLTRVNISILLAAILIGGGALRFAGLNWDGGRRFHTDERSAVIEPANALRLSDGLAPTVLAYGTLPMYLTRGLAELAGRGTDLPFLTLIGRALSALASTLSILLVYPIAARLFDRRSGLVAAACCAFSVLLVQNAHFGTVESMLALWLVGAAYAAVRIVQDGSWKAYALFGLFAGLGAATKTTALTFLALLAAAHLIAWRSQRRRSDLGPTAAATPVGWTLVAAVVGVCVLAGIGLLVNSGHSPAVRHNVPLLMAAAVGAAGLLTFAVSRTGVSRWTCLFSAIGIATAIGFAGWPWAILSFSQASGETFLSRMTYGAGVVTGAIDEPYGEAFHCTLPYGYVLEQMILWTLGPPLGLVAVVGLIYALWQATDAPGRARWFLLAAWAGPFIPALVFRMAAADPLSYTPTPSWISVPAMALAGVLWLVSLRATRGRVGCDSWLLLLAWTMPYFLSIGGWKVKFVRYSVPLIPILCVFGGAMLTAWWDAAQRRWARIAAGTAIAATITCAALYSLAFVGVYLSPNTRLEASRWMRVQIPANATVLREQWWDEGLPLDFPGLPTGRLRGIDGLNSKYIGTPADGAFQIHWQEVASSGWQLVLNRAKLDYLADAISSADYIVIAGSRHYRGILARKEAYPIASRYYQALFAGRLGYREAAVFASYPRLFGVEYHDDAAEENFVNFDRPKIRIFANEQRLTVDDIRARLRP